MPEVSISITRSGASAALAQIRRHFVTMDRPDEKGGEDLGPMGGETLLAALGGCFMSNLLAAASARGLDLGEIELEITGTLDGSPPVFREVTMTVAGPRGDMGLEKLVTIAERGCIVANTLRNGVSLSLSVVSP